MKNSSSLSDKQLDNALINAINQCQTPQDVDQVQTFMEQIIERDGGLGMLPTDRVIVWNNIMPYLDLLSQDCRYVLEMQITVLKAVA